MMKNKFKQNDWVTVPGFDFTLTITTVDAFGSVPHYGVSWWNSTTKQGGVGWMPVFYVDQVAKPVEWETA